jgi:hypothetical protein
MNASFLLRNHLVVLICVAIHLRHIFIVAGYPDAFLLHIRFSSLLQTDNSDSTTATLKTIVLNC